MTSACRGKLGRQLVGHHCEGVVRAGIAGKKNGELLKLAEANGYDVLLSVDQGIPYQQQLGDRRIALIIIHAVSNKIEVLEPHVAAVSEALRSIKPGKLCEWDSAAQKPISLVRREAKYLLKTHTIQVST